MTSAIRANFTKTQIEPRSNSLKIIMRKLKNFNNWKKKKKPHAISTGRHPAIIQYARRIEQTRKDNDIKKTGIVCGDKRRTIQGNWQLEVHPNDRNTAFLVGRRHSRIRKNRSTFFTVFPCRFAKKARSIWVKVAALKKVSITMNF